MARTVAQIQNLMLADIASDDTLTTALTSSSKYAIFRLFTFIVATAIWIHETFFDQHTVEIDTKIYNQKSGRPSWYREMALKFQYGFDLVADKDYFDNGTASQEQIEDSKIIKYAAVNESDDESRLIIKIAGEVDGVLTDFTDPSQVIAIKAYFKEIKYPGKITIINYKADQLYLNIQIKRDALVLNESGMSILNANYPVREAIQEFMKELPFDGDLKRSALVDKMQKVPGVLDATILSAESSWIDPELNGYATPQPIFISKVAVSGYFEIVTFDNINYVV
ncbi:nucleotidyltransferase [Flavobacterium aestivum]|uniref:nucleotidyltransferase n=1 Tax=Flavobacterium aestivum TaxID=3003257 RepID=UPI002482F7B8|nr:nucleotidyltransferase [Flavobacterium aestivum]